MFRYVHFRTWLFTILLIVAWILLWHVVLTS